MATTISITNAASRDGTVRALAVPREPSVALGLPDRAVEFRRYLAATESCVHDALQSRFGEDYGQALIDGDPEIDWKHIGRRIGDTNTVFLTPDGEFLHSPPSMIEVIIGADGTERERRTPVDVEPNIGLERPMRWTGRKFPVADAVRKFVFRRSLQITHVDGVTYDFLYAMAADLSRESMVMLVGAGPKGNDPLIFQANGRPSRGFLEGRVEGERYQLLLHLSDMELRRPEVKEV